MAISRELIKSYETDEYGFGDDFNLYLKPRKASRRLSKKTLSTEEKTNGAELYRLELTSGKIKRQMARLTGALYKLRASDVKILPDVLKIEQLAELIGVVCEEDAPWGAPVAEPTWGRENKDKSLQVLNEQTAATHELIQSREDHLISVRKEAEKLEESLNDVCGKATKIQKDLRPVQKFFEERSVTLKKEAEEAEAEVLKKVMEHIKARIIYDQQAGAIKRKRENNATIFDSIGTLFSDPVAQPFASFFAATTNMRLFPRTTSISPMELESIERYSTKWMQ